MNGAEKWPKTFPPLTPEQQRISDDFMKYWHEVLPDQYSIADRFNHRYVVSHSPYPFVSTLEIGAGRGEHLTYEKLSPEQEAGYVAVELRQNMADDIKARHPNVQTYVGDCQQRMDFADNHFDRIVAIHVLEHLPNLPSTVREMYRLCNKEHGFCSVVIPCEGSLAYSFARKISAQRIFEKRYKMPYRWWIEREHINLPHEIFEELAPYFHISQRSFFPVPLPFLFCNLFIGLTLLPRRQVQSA